MTVTKQYGEKVLTIDLDPQGNLTDAFNINAEEIPAIINVIEGRAKIQDAIINVSYNILMNS